MNIITKQISELKPYENNPKIHTDSQIDKIAKSIELTKGLRQPIVIDKNNVIVCGHGRYLAALKLGYDTVPCELVDDLTDDEIRAYRLIDNRISEGEYDLSLNSLQLNFRKKSKNKSENETAILEMKEKEHTNQPILIDMMKAEQRAFIKCR